MKRLVGAAVAAVVLCVSGQASAAIMSATIEGALGYDFSDSGNFGIYGQAPFEPFKLVFTYDTANVVRNPTVKFTNNDGFDAYSESEYLALNPGSPNAFLSAAVTINNVTRVFSSDLPGGAYNSTGTFGFQIGEMNSERLDYMAVYGGDYFPHDWFGEVPFKSLTQPNTWTNGLYCHLVCERIVLATDLGMTTGFINDFTLTVDFVPVPEPANWALMIMGFGAAGAMLRRRAVGHAIDQA